MPFLQAIAKGISARWIHLSTDCPRRGRSNYEQTWNGCLNPSVSYEVIRVRRRDGFQINGRFVEPAEIYPKSEAWGVDGFTLTNKDAAFAKLRDLNER